MECWHEPIDDNDPLKLLVDKEEEEGTVDAIDTKIIIDEFRLSHPRKGITVLEFLRGPVSKATLARRLGISRQTVHNHLESFGRFYRCEKNHMEQRRKTA